MEERTIGAMDLVEDMVEAFVDRPIGLNAIVDDIKCAFVAEDGDRYGTSVICLLRCKCIHAIQI